MYNDNEKILLFLRGDYPNDSGKTLADISSFSDSEIELYHDFIQWIFPTDKCSAYNHKAPIINFEIINVFQKDNIAKDNFCKSCKRYLKYIGINCDNHHLSIYDDSRIFNIPSHNYLRITRVLDSLNCMGNHYCSRQVFRLLKEIINKQYTRTKDIIVSFQYWENTQKENML